jgi:selenocysteine-specific elongation factor
VDAGEGARPQTHEHLAIVRLLGIEHGVVAVTKIDAVDTETRELALEEARELVPDSRVVATSARTGEGLDELRAALGEAADRVVERPSSRPTRLFVDRVFTLRGIGTVATGTLWSGSLGEGDELRVEPAGLDVRVRSVQVHDRPVERAEAGQRVAAALPGIERTSLRRGDALVEPGAYPISYRLDVALEALEEIADGARLHVHHGTAEHFARVVRIDEGHAQLRLATPAVAARGDRVVLREQTTLGGALVLDPSPPRRPSADRLALLERGDAASIVLAVLSSAAEPMRREELGRRALLSEEELDEGLAAAVRAGEWYLTPELLEELSYGIVRRLDERAAGSSLDPGIPVSELLPPRPWAPVLLPLLPIERRGAKAYAPGAAARLGDRAEAAERLEDELEAAGFTPVKVEDAELARYLEDAGRLVRLGDGLAVGSAAYEEARRLLLDECSAAGSIALARFRDLLGTGRKPAQLLLERFDADGLTRRVGDERVLRRRARPD